MQYVKGPLLVLGGAGSGKTSLLAHKVAWLIREYDVPPAHVVAIAANSHAARLLRTRIAEILGYQLPGLLVPTFREIGLSLIQQRFDELGLLPGFSLYDRLDSEAVISRLLREAKPQLLSLTAAAARQIARWKRELKGPSADTDGPGSSVTEAAGWLYRRYEQRLRTANAIDLEDLVRKAVRLLTTDPALITEWRDRIRFLLIDEYERSTGAEHELVRLLTADGALLTVTGDETVPIRGLDPDASGDNLAQLRTELPDLRVIKLERNFRSTTRIARALAALARAGQSSRDLPVAPGARQGTKLRVLRVRSEQQEADAIVSFLMDHKRRHETDYRDYAVLLPRLEQAPLIERALQNQRVPYTFAGGPSFFDHVEVRDLWSYLRLLCNPADDIAFLRAINTPRRDIDRSTLDLLVRFATERGRPLLDCALDPELAVALAPARSAALQRVADLLQTFGERAQRSDPVQLAYDLLAELRYDEWLRDTCNDLKIAEQRMQNVVELINRLQRLGKQRPEAKLRTLVAQLTLDVLVQPDRHEPAAEGVALLPLDSAKGLEFRHIFLAGFEEGLLPRAFDPASELDRERRRAYAAIACARDGVTFTVTEQRRLTGEVAARRASRFLLELAADDLDWVNAADTAGGAEPLLGRAAIVSGGLYPGRRPR